jgi:DNA topoisomerase-1
MTALVTCRDGGGRSVSPVTGLGRGPSQVHRRHAAAACNAAATGTDLARVWLRAERPHPCPVITDGPSSARAAGLRYSNDTRPGISRRRAGRGFAYRDADGAPIRDTAVLGRIRALAIPPAWTDVWICPDPAGHLQATGRDARGRKQYRYHARWRVGRDESKFERLIDFGRALPRIRRRCDADLARPGLAREKVLATVVRLLEATLIRVGNDEYARLNRSFGLTTLRGRHVRVDGTSIRFRFRGKSGQRHEVGLRDRRLAAIVRRCQELPGQELFAYVGPDGEVHDIASDDVNDYLREISGADVTAKDFRTWAGTVLAYRALRAAGVAEDARDAQRNVVAAVKQTALQLGNTPAVARRSYVHPAVVDAYLDGSFRGALLEAAESRVSPPTAADRAEELEVIALLRRQLASRRSGRPQHRR